MVKSFYDVLVQQAPRMGIRIALPKVVPISTDRAEAYLGAIRAVPEGTQMASKLIPFVRKRHIGIDCKPVSLFLADDDCVPWRPAR